MNRNKRTYSQATASVGNNPFLVTAHPNGVALAAAAHGIAPPAKKLKDDQQRMQYLLDKFDEFQSIGAGTFGEVFQARDKSANKRVAIKLFHKTKDGEGVSLTAYRELMLLRELKHENIISLCSICISPAEKSISLILDYAEYDLSELIRFHGRSRLTPIPIYTIKSILWQILNAIHYLHTNWVCHRDMKPSNTLIMGKGSEEGTVKIADFGLARIYQSPIRPLSENGVVVTIWYRAPELLLGSKHYTKAVDMWAIGCIFAELLTTQALFPGKEKDQKNPNLFQDIQLDRIFKTLGKPSTHVWPDLNFLPDWRTNRNKWKDTITEKEWNTYPDFVADANSPHHRLRQIPQLAADRQAFDLLCKMLEYDPAKRISASAALDHDYFKQEPHPGKKVFQIEYPLRSQLRKSS